VDGSLALDPRVARDFAIALLIGALIGIEREKRKTEQGTHEVGGIRTFILFSQIGALSAWFSRQLASPWPFAVAVLAVAVLVSAAYVALRRDGSEDVGLTTEAAALVTTLLGGAALFGFADIAGALGIVTAAVLAFKQPIHWFVGRIGLPDLYAGLKLLIATFIVLPLLPRQALDPLGVINPYELWLLVVLISTLSLVGYVAVRWLGSGLGTVLTGLFGGLVSSTAVTLTFARRSRERGDAERVDALVAGMVLAWMVMFARILIEVALVHPPLLARVLAPQLAMFGTAALAAAWFYRESRHTPEAPCGDVDLSNPFSLTSAIKFAAVFAIVLVAVALMQRYSPGKGELVVAAVAGFTDVDAITLSMATFARDGGNATTAAQAIAVASLTNTLTKCGLAVALAAVSVRRRIAPVTAIVVLSGVLALWLG
jgi:uncharacterized membrane protein (DUF4010 family)